MKVVRIKSHQDGFRRCGIAHSGEWTEYPEGFFKPEQLARLKAEPMLWVEEIEKKAPAKKEEPTEEKPEERSKDKK